MLTKHIPHSITSANLNQLFLVLKYDVEYKQIKIILTEQREIKGKLEINMSIEREMRGRGGDNKNKGEKLNERDEQI